MTTKGSANIPEPGSGTGSDSAMLSPYDWWIQACDERAAAGQRLTAAIAVIAASLRANGEPLRMSGEIAAVEAAQVRLAEIDQQMAAYLRQLTSR